MTGVEVLAEEMLAVWASEIDVLELGLADEMRLLASLAVWLADRAADSQIPCVARDRALAEVQRALHASIQHERDARKRVV